MERDYFVETEEDSKEKTANETKIKKYIRYY